MWCNKALNLTELIAQMRSTPMVSIFAALHGDDQHHRFRDLRSPLWLHKKPLDPTLARERTGVGESGERLGFACPLIDCDKWYKKRGYLTRHISTKHSGLRQSDPETWAVLELAMNVNLVRWEVPAGLSVRTMIFRDDERDDDAINAAEPADI